MKRGSCGKGRDIVLAHLSPRSRQDRRPACHIGLADGKAIVHRSATPRTLLTRSPKATKTRLRPPMRLALPVEDGAPPFKTGFARSKAKRMDPEIARNQNYDNHYANDSEDVHSVLLPFHDDSAQRARSSYVSVAIKLIASFRHRWLDATELTSTSRFHRHRLYPQ